MSLDSRYDSSAWARAYGNTTATGVIRSVPADFQVEEILGFEPDGGGEHTWLFIEKSGENTQWVAEQLAKAAGVPLRAVGYAGMKDRHAITRQWFSVQLPKSPDGWWSSVQSDCIQVLRTARHLRKLKQGTPLSNRFRLQVRKLQGDTAQLAARIELCRLTGVPNYFGEQRFGREGANVAQAAAMFAGEIRPRRHLHSVYLSAARGFLFNRVLQQRIQADNWNRVLSGDILMLSHSRSRFAAQAGEEPLLQERVQRGELHITGPLYGLNPITAAALEKEIPEYYPELVHGLIAFGVEADRRPLRLLPTAWQWQIEGDSLLLEFILPAGSYATAVLRELLKYSDQDV
jgi:tRNA pseudouridine13 synthase